MFEKILFRFLSGSFFKRLSRNTFDDNEAAYCASLLAHPLHLIWHKTWFFSRDFRKERVVSLYNAVMALPDRDYLTFKDEIDFLRHVNPAEPHQYPYAPLKDPERIDSGFDEDVHLPYVMHGEHKLYFPKSLSIEEAVLQYRSYLETEGILGTGCLRKSPHSYFSDCLQLDDNDVVVDVGCSEGLFGLACAEKAKRVYLFETLSHWKKPNEFTFSCFGEKVRIYNKFVGGATDGHTIRLDDALNEEEADSTFFVKMDIEGGERMVLASCADFLKKHKVKLACAAYHRQDDSEVLAKMLRDMGYVVSFSDGYMLPLINDVVYPYFRRGMIYAKNF